jgi:hypothetical protein
MGKNAVPFVVDQLMLDRKEELSYVGLVQVVSMGILKGFCMS